MAAKRVNVSAAITGTVLLTAALFGTLPATTGAASDTSSLEEVDESTQPVEVFDVVRIDVAAESE